MSIGAYNENAYENAVLEVLRSMKWEYMYGPDIERDYSDPTLPDVFEYQVRKLNKSVPDEAVNDAIRQVRGIAGGSVVVRNEKYPGEEKLRVQAGNPHPYPNYPAMGLPFAAFIQYYR